MLTDRERGASAVILAASMIVLLAMAAIAVDVGAGFNERRQGQTAADVGVMAGAVETVNGGAAVRAQVLDFVERNLDTTYTAAEYQTLWENCVDPAADRNTEAGDNFVALPGPTGWTLVDAANWCISLDGQKGLLRVRIPDQISDNNFAQVIGSDGLITSAPAVAEIVFGTGAGGVLPFGLPSGAGGGEHLCLSSGPTGNSLDPCTGASSGNFGTVFIRQFGNVDLGTSANCPNIANPNNTLAQNIATGADHLLVTDPDALVSNEVRDYTCGTPFPDTLQTDTGFPNNGAEQGLVGPVPGGFTPRLAQAGNQVSVFGNSVNDTPLWTYLLPQTNGTDGNPDYTNATASTADDAPASCNPSSFVAGPMDWDGDTVDDDANGDGVADEGNSWLHLFICMRQYLGDFNFDGDTADAVDTAAYSAVMISDTILSNTARFAYVPQFHESALGPGTDWKHIERFRAVYLQSTTWKKGNTYVFHHPGESCSCSGNGYAMRQLTAFTFPDAALPEELRGDPIPGSTGLNPFSSSLKR